MYLPHSKTVRAIDSFPRGVVVFGRFWRTEPTIPPPGPDHQSFFFWRRIDQSAINDAVCSFVGTSPVNSNQNTASALGDFPSRGKSVITSGIVSPLYLIYTKVKVVYFRSIFKSISEILLKIPDFYMVSKNLLKLH